MKKQHKAAISFALALIFALVSLPASALPRFAANAEVTPAWTVPEGYNAHDYTKCVTFLEQTDENGVKNGEKLSSTYNPNNPETWGSYYGTACFLWTAANGEQRVYKIKLSPVYDALLCGGLDLSGCTALEWLECSSNNLTELDVSGCTALEYLDCYHSNLTELNVSDCTALRNLLCFNNNLTELDVSGCTALEFLNCAYNSLTELDVSGCAALDGIECYTNNLTELDITDCTALRQLNCGYNNLIELNVMQNTSLEWLWCDFNNLTELDVTGCPALERLDCSSNNLTELDVSGCAALEYLDCSSNNLTELDLSNQVKLPFDYVLSQGNGNIGYNHGYGPYEETTVLVISAYPSNYAQFEGFYNENGVLISHGSWDAESGAYIYYNEYYWPSDGGFSEIPTGTIIARFSGGYTPGDIDGNGSVTVADAITALRLAMGLLDGSGLNTDAADMDGNGSITIVDAITILRTAMGLA